MAGSHADPAGFVLPLVVGSAIELTLSGETFAARQVDPAMLAAHHVFTALGRRRRATTLDAAAIAFQYPVDEEQAEDEQDDLRQKPSPCAAICGLVCRKPRAASSPRCISK